MAKGSKSKDQSSKTATVKKRVTRKKVSDKTARKGTRQSKRVASPVRKGTRQSKRVASPARKGTRQSKRVASPVRKGTRQSKRVASSARKGTRQSKRVVDLEQRSSNKSTGSHGRKKKKENVSLPDVDHTSIKKNDQLIDLNKKPNAHKADFEKELQHFVDIENAKLQKHASGEHGGRSRGFFTQDRYDLTVEYFKLKQEQLVVEVGSDRSMVINSILSKKFKGKTMTQFRLGEDDGKLYRVKKSVRTGRLGGIHSINLSSLDMDMFEEVIAIDDGKTFDRINDIHWCSTNPLNHISSQQLPNKVSEMYGLNIPNFISLSLIKHCPVCKIANKPKRTNTSCGPFIFTAINLKTFESKLKVNCNHAFHQYLVICLYTKKQYFDFIPMGCADNDEVIYQLIHMFNAFGYPSSIRYYEHLDDPVKFVIQKPDGSTNLSVDQFEQKLMQWIKMSQSPRDDGDLSSIASIRRRSELLDKGIEFMVLFIEQFLKNKTKIGTSFNAWVPLIQSFFNEDTSYQRRKPTDFLTTKNPQSLFKEWESFIEKRLEENNTGIEERDSENTSSDEESNKSAKSSPEDEESHGTKSSSDNDEDPEEIVEVVDDVRHDVVDLGLINHPRKRLSRLSLSRTLGSKKKRTVPSNSQNNSPSKGTDHHQSLDTDSDTASRNSLRKLGKGNKKSLSNDLEDEQSDDTDANESQCHNKLSLKGKKLIELPQLLVKQILVDEGSMNEEPTAKTPTDTLITGEVEGSSMDEDPMPKTPTSVPRQVPDEISITAVKEVGKQSSEGSSMDVDPAPKTPTPDPPQVPDDTLISVVKEVSSKKIPAKPMKDILQERTDFEERSAQKETGKTKNVNALKNMFLLQEQKNVKK